MTGAAAGESDEKFWVPHRRELGDRDAVAALGEGIDHAGRVEEQLAASVAEGVADRETRGITDRKIGVTPTEVQRDVGRVVDVDGVGVGDDTVRGDRGARAYLGRIGNKRCPPHVGGQTENGNQREMRREHEGATKRWMLPHLSHGSRRFRISAVVLECANLRGP